MDLKTEIVRKKPREKAGAHTGSMYTFQKHWGMCKLLELHRIGKDYAVVFEYHDDILVFDSSTKPKYVSFFQVKGKTTNGNWTLGKLLERKPPTANSILGKMYINRVNFSDSVESINFVSNAPYSFHLVSEGKATSCPSTGCSKLHSSVIKKIFETLKEEHGIDSDDGFVNQTFFLSADIDIRNQEDSPKARLIEALEEGFPGIPYNIPPIYRMVLDEIKRRSDNTEDFTDFDSLLKKKAITKIEFNEMLKTMVSQTSNEQKKCEEIIGRLNGTEAAPMDVVDMFSRHYRRVLIERKNGDSAFLELQKDIQQIINVMPELPTLLGRMSHVYAKLEVVYPRLYPEPFVKTLILFMAYSPQ